MIAIYHAAERHPVINQPLQVFSRAVIQILPEGGVDPVIEEGGFSRKQILKMNGNPFCLLHRGPAGEHSFRHKTVAADEPVDLQYKHLVSVCAGLHGRTQSGCTGADNHDVRIKNLGRRIGPGLLPRRSKGPRGGFSTARAVDGAFHPFLPHLLHAAMGTAFLIVCCVVHIRRSKTAPGTGSVPWTHDQFVGPVGKSMGESLYGHSL